MAAKTSWRRCGTKLRHCHPMYSKTGHACIRRTRGCETWLFVIPLRTVGPPSNILLSAWLRAGFKELPLAVFFFCPSAFWCIFADYRGNSPRSVLLSHGRPWLPEDRPICRRLLDDCVGVATICGCPGGRSSSIFKLSDEFSFCFRF